MKSSSFVLSQKWTLELASPARPQGHSYLSTTNLASLRAAGLYAFLSDILLPKSSSKLLVQGVLHDLSGGGHPEYHVDVTGANRQSLQMTSKNNLLQFSSTTQTADTSDVRTKPKSLSIIIMCHFDGHDLSIYIYKAKSSYVRLCVCV